jgi:hypothetical protein
MIEQPTPPTPSERGSLCRGQVQGWGFLCYLSFGFHFYNSRLPPPPLKGGVSSVVGFRFGVFYVICHW